MPVMENDGEAQLAKLKGTDWVFLQSLAKEKYTEADFAKPGTLTFTVKITDDTPTYFDYAWCTTSEEIGMIPLTPIPSVPMPVMDWCAWLLAC